MRVAFSGFMHHVPSPTPVLLLLAASFVSFACWQRREKAPTTPEAPTHTAAAASSNPDREEQLAVGARYFARDCAGCHGATGEGTQVALRIIGPGALPVNPPPYAMQRKTHFVTAAGVFRFIATHMPNDVIGQSTDSYYWDTLAFVLSRNGVDLHGRVLDGTTAGVIAPQFVDR